MSWIFVLYLFVALHVAALIGGIITRCWPIRPQQLIWRGTAVEFAATQIQALLYDIDDANFAYPTGQFVPVGDETNHAAGHVVMHEANFKGSKGFGMVLHLFAMAGTMTRSVAEESIGLAFVVGFIAFWFASFLAAPFLIASVIDVVYRRLYRSRITAAVRSHPTIADAVTVDLEFRGLSAFGIVGDVMRAGAAPSAPAGSREASTAAATAEDESSRTRATQWASAAERRSSVLYGSGVGAALLVAGVLALAMPHPFDASGSVSGSSSYDNTSAGYSSSDGSSGDPSASDTTTTDQGTSGDGSTTDPTAGSAATTQPKPGYESSSGNYTVLPPSGWVKDSDEKDKGGFYETRWHLPGESGVYGLVDYTPGFSGTPLDGARGQRTLLSRRDDYEELDFSAVGDARRWEFVASGAHKIDIFFRCGDVGVAVLGAAPAGEWDTYASDISEFVDSFACSTPATSPEQSDQAPPSAGEQVYSLTTNSGHMERAIRNHWKARLDGDYSRAFAYYTGPVRRHVGLESSWAEQVHADGLTRSSSTASTVSSPTPTAGGSERASARNPTQKAARTGRSHTTCCTAPDAG